jgi:SAM-dependent methyltransferase
MKQKEFITSDGITIPMIPNWYETNCPNKPAKFLSYYDSVFVKKEYPELTLGFLLNKLSVVTYFLETLREVMGVYPSCERMLDIGTGMGIQPAMIKAAGAAREAWGVDWVDRRVQQNQHLLLSQYTRQLQDVVVNGVEENKRQMKVTADEIMTMHGSIYPLFIDFPDAVDFKMDRYVVDEFIEWEDFPKDGFDLITAFSSLDYFDAGKSLEKISGLLRPGGLFFVTVGNWYNILFGATGLPMDVPFLQACLTYDDLLRYYREIRPEIAEYADKCIYFINHHMTVDNYCELASEYGMSSLYHRKGIMKNILDSFLYSNSGMSQYFYNNTLPLSRRLNKSVQTSDFFAYYLTMVFKKD